MDKNNVSRPLIMGIIGVLFILITFGIAYFLNSPEFTYDYPNRTIQKNDNQEIALPKTTGKAEDIEKALQAEISNEDSIWKEEDQIAGDIMSDDEDVSSLGQSYEDQI